MSDEMDKKFYTEVDDLLKHEGKRDAALKASEAMTWWKDNVTDPDFPYHVEDKDPSIMIMFCNDVEIAQGHDVYGLIESAYEHCQPTTREASEQSLCPLLKSLCVRGCAWNVDGVCAIAILGLEASIAFEPQVEEPESRLSSAISFGLE